MLLGRILLNGESIDLNISYPHGTFTDSIYDTFESIPETSPLTYEDISSIVNWDKYGQFATLTFTEIRNEIKALYEATTWESLTAEEKKVVSRWFIVNKSERDEVKSEAEQAEDSIWFLENINYSSGDYSSIKDGDTSDVDSILSNVAVGIFGPSSNSYEYIENEEPIVTYSTNGIPHTVITVTGLDNAKKYLCEGMYIWSHDGTSDDFWCEIRQNGTNIFSERHRQEPKDSAGSGTGGTDQRYFTKWIKEVSPINGSITLDITYGTYNNDRESTIYFSNIIVHK